MKIKFLTWDTEASAKHRAIWVADSMIDKGIDAEHLLTSNLDFNSIKNSIVVFIKTLEDKYNITEKNLITLKDNNNILVYDPTDWWCFHNKHQDPNKDKYKYIDGLIAYSEPMIVHEQVGRKSILPNLKAAAIIEHHIDKKLWNEVISLEKAFHTNRSKIKEKTGIKDKIFFHRDCVPLDKVDLENKNQLNLFENECEGYCGN